MSRRELGPGDVSGRSISPGRRAVLMGAVAVAGATATAVWFDLSSPLRPLLIVVFVLLVPGLAVTAWLDLGEPPFELTVAMLTSVSVVMAIAQLQALSTAWDPKLGFLALAVPSMASLLLRLAPDVARPVEVGS